MALLSFLDASLLSAYVVGSCIEKYSVDYEHNLSAAPFHSPETLIYLFLCIPLFSGVFPISHAVVN